MTVVGGENHHREAFFIIITVASEPTSGPLPSPNFFLFPKPIPPLNFPTYPPESPNGTGTASTKNNARGLHLHGPRGPAWLSAGATHLIPAARVEPVYSLNRIENGLL